MDSGRVSDPENSAEISGVLYSIQNDKKRGLTDFCRYIKQVFHADHFFLGRLYSYALMSFMESALEEIFCFELYGNAPGFCRFDDGVQMPLTLLKNIYSLNPPP